MKPWVLTVGLEVHVELETKTKMFCGCPNDPFHSRPNTNVCPVCYGLPGSLPLLNQKAIELTIQLGRALNGKVADKTFWARKNYFYPDLPKGYQISQSTEPLIGHATLVIDNVVHRINRIHLEEDAGKLVHSSGGSNSLVDYNRAGVPLLELVTEPDFHSSEDAKRFCQELQSVVRHLKISKADMEKGQMRCEANISVAREGEALGTKVEVKNLNSFRSVERAVSFEFDRQVKALEADEELRHETRLWDEAANRTVPMRTKETSADYRYFPEPDLPKVSVPVVLDIQGSTHSHTSGNIKHILPNEQRATLREKLGFPEAIAKIVVDRQQYDSVMDTYQKASAFSQKDDQVRRIVLEDAKQRIGSPNFAKLTTQDRIKLLEARDSMGWTKAFIEEVVDQVLAGEPIGDLISHHKDAFDSVDLESIAKEVVAQNAPAVADYKAGKESSLNFLVGQVMARTKGQASISSVREFLLREL